MSVRLRLAIGLGCVGVSALAGAGSAVAASTLTVANSNDKGAGSLRQALLDATSGDTIVVPSGIGAITLTSGELLVNKSLTIQGAGSGDTVISGNKTSRVFRVTGPVSVTISGAQIVGGNPAPEAERAKGGGILVHDANLTVSNSVITTNRADM